MANNLETTNYVVCSCASDVEDGMCLDEIWLLGWDNRHDWFTTDIDSCDIMTPKGNIKKCQYGFMIQTSRHESAYVGNTQANCQSYCDDANREGYDCCVCRLEKVNDEWLVYKV